MQLEQWRTAAKVDALPASAATATASAAAASSADDTPLPGHFPSAKRFDPRRHPITDVALPPMVKQAINAVAVRVYDNVVALAGRDGTAARNQAKDRVISQIFAVLPPTLLVLLPVFALLLKLVYLFKRRLYVEHQLRRAGRCGFDGRHGDRIDGRLRSPNRRSTAVPAPAKWRPGSGKTTLSPRVTVTCSNLPQRRLCTASCGVGRSTKLRTVNRRHTPPDDRCALIDHCFSISIFR